MPQLIRFNRGTVLSIDDCIPEFLHTRKAFSICGLLKTLYLTMMDNAQRWTDKRRRRAIIAAIQKVTRYSIRTGRGRW